MKYRKIKRPFPPPLAAHPGAHSPPPAVPPARSRPAAAAWDSSHRPLALRAEGGGRAAEGGSLSIVFVDPVSLLAIPTGHPTKPWTGPEKQVLNEALKEWDDIIRKFEHHGSTWTLRWEDGDLFKNWGAGCDFRQLGAITGTPAQFAACNIPAADFPTNEIYFDVRQP